MNIVWYGTATLAIDDGETRLLFDPFIRRNKKLENPTIEDYTGANAILITHGHFDHIGDVPKIVREDKDVKIYCTQTPYRSLKRMRVTESRIEVIKPNDKFSIGNFNIYVYRGRHADFDGEHIKQVFFDCVIKFPLFLHYFLTNISMPENKETVIYEIENNGKRVLIMGSYGYDKEIIYPKDVDMLVMPFGGSQKIKNMAVPFIENITPRCIFADHHDNAFPPLTRRMDVEGFAEILTENRLEAKYIVPDEYRAYIV